MTITLRNGATTEDPRLDRVPFFDPRSRDHTIRAALPAQSTAHRDRYRWWTPGPTLDQGSEGQCVAEACVGAHNGRPLSRRPLVTEFAQRRAFYHEAQHRDPWTGCASGPSCTTAPSPQSYGGTSVLAGAQLGRERGWWSSYRWIGAGSQRLADDVVDTLTLVGPIVFGIAWHESMYATTPQGLIEVGGAQVGGHAIRGWEWAPRQRMPAHWGGTRPGVWLHNSWGPSYGVTRRGVTGCGFIPLEVLVGLLEAGGEGMVPIA